MKNLNNKNLSKKLSNAIMRDKYEMGENFCYHVKNEIIRVLNEYIYFDETRCKVKFLMYESGVRKIVVECEIDDSMF